MPATIRSGGWVPGSRVVLYRGGGDATRHERRCQIGCQRADEYGTIELEVKAAPGEALHAASAGPDERTVTVYSKAA